MKSDDERKNVPDLLTYYNMMTNRVLRTDLLTNSPNYYIRLPTSMEVF